MNLFLVHVVRKIWRYVFGFFQHLSSLLDYKNLNHTDYTIGNRVILFIYKCIYTLHDEF